MENKKWLKIVSIILLVLGAFELINGVIALVLTLNGSVTVPEGQTEEVFRTAGIATFVGALLGALLDLFLGIKGIQKANGREIGKAAHILGIIILVFQIIAVVVGAIGLIQAFTVTSLISLLISVLEAAGLVVYVKGTK